MAHPSGAKVENMRALDPWLRFTLRESGSADSWRLARRAPRSQGRWGLPALRSRTTRLGLVRTSTLDAGAATIGRRSVASTSRDTALGSAESGSASTCGAGTMRFNVVRSSRDPRGYRSTNCSSPDPDVTAAISSAGSSTPASRRVAVSHAALASGGGSQFRLRCITSTASATTTVWRICKSSAPTAMVKLTIGPAAISDNDGASH